MANNQAKVQKFIKENNFDCPLEHRTLDLVSEIGEVAKEVLLMSNYGRHDLQKREELFLELGDVYFSLIAVANKVNVDLDTALDAVLDKYKKRLETK